jgi:hypothetical protein
MPGMMKKEERREIEGVANAPNDEERREKGNRRGR